MNTSQVKLFDEKRILYETNSATLHLSTFKKSKIILPNKRLIAFVAFLLIVMNPLILLGQIEEGTTQKSLNFGIGYSHMRMLDRSATQLVYSSNSIPVYFGYSKLKDKSFFTSGISIEPGMVGSAGSFRNREVFVKATNSTGNLETKEITISNTFNYKEQITASYYRYVWGLPDSKINLYAGGTLVEYFFLSFSMVPILFHSELSLNPALYGTCFINSNTRLFGSIAFPLVGLNTHLPYSKDPVDGKHGHIYVTYAKGSKLSGPKDYQRINFDVELEKEFNSLWCFSIGYRFYWFRYKTDNLSHTYDNSIIFNIKRKLQ